MCHLSHVYFPYMLEFMYVLLLPNMCVLAHEWLLYHVSTYMYSFCVTLHLCLSTNIVSPIQCHMAFPYDEKRSYLYKTRPEKLHVFSTIQLFLKQHGCAQLFLKITYHVNCFTVSSNSNDPTAGSPTVTLLRLLPGPYKHCHIVSTQH